MNTDKYIEDIVCQVLAPYKSKDLIYSVINEFIPNYEKINLDYTGKPDDSNYTFKSEEEMINCYVETPNVEQTFYWNGYKDNNEKIMVGANITSDNQIVFSLTFNGTSKAESKNHLRLKRFLNSKIGVISYVNPVEYQNAADFKNRYSKVKYEFE